MPDRSFSLASLALRVQAVRKAGIENSRRSNEIQYFGVVQYGRGSGFGPGSKG
jgi:hypothetical protein